ncbi:hypothetical protein EJ08DRAFT_661875 [Tothia fuscella]|uniref:Uncharacterized protein n=1 Tax=Tothia fuscella TaxID=1048955 RepID=A0A9P4NPL5_9PEZI|nr:hypothetical protein EJ08DRAFT_661875 [Tothia fuscella]
MSRSIDDLQASGDAYGVYGMGMGFGAQSEDNLLTSPFDSTFDPGLFSSYSPALAGSVDGNGLTRTTSADALSASMTWYETNLPTVSESLGDYSTSPIGMFDFTGQDFTIPSATSVDFFSPSDLPLVTSNPADFSQPISNSGESNYQSAPALTASSGARSELGEPAFPIDGESSGPANITSQWSGTIQLRDTTPLTNVQDFSFPQSLPQMSKFDTSVKRKTSRTRHRHTYSAGSNSYQRFPPSASSEGTVREEPRATGVNIGHLQNLETLKQAREAAALASSQSSPGYPPVNESELHSITIPASIEDGSIDDDWYFPISDLPPQPSSTSTEFAWLS